MKPDNYFWNELKTQEERELFCKDSGSTYKYISKHILRKKGSTRTPRKEILVGMVNASNGRISLDDAIDHFLINPVKFFAKKQKENKRAA